MLPASVQRQVDRAKELSASNGGTADPAKPANTDPSAGAIEKLTADLAAATTEGTRWKSAYDALKGKYDAEVPRYATENRDLKAKVTDLEGQIARANIKPGNINSLSEDERQTAGPMVGITDKIVQERVSEAVDAATKPLKDEIAKMAARQSDELFSATLDMGLPIGWAEKTGVNEDPKFIKWLNELDPETAAPRMDRLKRAEAAKQGHLVVEIFRAFLENREIGARKQGKPKKDPANVDPPAGSGGGGVDLEEDGGKKIWTKAGISAFYAGKNRDPQYQGTEGKAKARAIEEDIAAAQREGRVRG